MKLNEEWDQVYRSATFNLQQRLEALELENSAIKTLNSKLLLKVEHQQVQISLLCVFQGFGVWGGGGGGVVCRGISDDGVCAVVVTEF